jgi:hypothetical protein
MPFGFCFTGDGFKRCLDPLDIAPRIPIPVFPPIPDPEPWLSGIEVELADDILAVARMEQVSQGLSAGLQRSFKPALAQMIEHVQRQLPEGMTFELKSEVTSRA